MKTENVKSDMKVTEYSVPQGSILGPLLFLLYVNDLSSCSSNGPRLCAADDTCLVVNDSSYVKLLEKVKEEICSVSKWMSAHKLTINITRAIFCHKSYIFFTKSICHKMLKNQIKTFLGC